jgi:hypothetical protein
MPPSNGRAYARSSAAPCALTAISSTPNVIPNAATAARKA